MTRKIKSRARGIDAILGGERRLPVPAKSVTAEVVPVAAPAAKPSEQQQLQNDVGALGSVLGFPGTNGAIPPALAGQQAVSNPQTLFDGLRWFLVSNLRQILSEAYLEIGLVQTICDVPVDDALRGGIEIKSKQLSADELELLTSTIDREDDILIAGRAGKWDRLFGGAGVMVLTDQDPLTPLDIEAIDEKTPLRFKAVDLWELFFDRYDADQEVVIEDDDEVEPLDEGTHFYNYYGHRVHKSRVFKLTGLEAPSFVRPRMRGWGVSVVETLVRSINQYLKATDLGFQVLDEFKVDVYKIKNLTAALFSPQGREKMANRIQMANWQKNYQSAVVMDSEDDFDHKTVSFSGLGEAMMGIKQQVAADMRMPMTKLFGISSAGFNSGEDDIEVYNAMVESGPRARLKRPLHRMVEIRCQKLFGYVPEDLTIKYKALRVLSATDEETVKTQKFARLFQAKQAGEITVKEFRDGCNKAGIFDIPLDDADNVIKEIESDQKAAEAQVPPGGDKPPPAKAAPDDKTGGKAKPAGKPEKPVTNSAEFDKASYEADGGDRWIDARREAFFTRDEAKDKDLWADAEAASSAALGEIRWQFVVYWYQKNGGKFH